MQLISVYVISLARAAARRAAICKHLTSHDVEFTIMEGVDGATLHPEELSRLMAPGACIHPGAVGCYLSHLRVYQDIVDKSTEMALVLEDDARISARVIEFLRSPPPPAPAFDYCFLDCDDHDDAGPIFYDSSGGQALAGGLSAYTLSAGPHTLHAYLITGAAARRRLAHGLPITKPIDTYGHLPYPIRFAAMVNPRGAWVSEHSLISDTSERRVLPSSIPLRLLRRWPAFYQLREWLSLGSMKRRRLAKEFVAQGRLPPGRSWIALPRGRDILVED
jgi:hypothetical protein